MQITKLLSNRDSWTNYIGLSAAVALLYAIQFLRVCLKMSTAALECEEIGSLGEIEEAK